MHVCFNFHADTRLNQIKWNHILYLFLLQKRIQNPAKHLISNMECFAKIAIFTEHSILDVSQGSNYTSATLQTIKVIRSCFRIPKLTKKTNFMAPFYGWGSTASKLGPLQVGSLLFTTKFPEIPRSHFIDIGRKKGWVDLGATQWFWTRDTWIGNPVP